MPNVLITSLLCISIEFASVIAGASAAVQSFETPSCAHAAAAHLPRSRIAESSDAGRPGAPTPRVDDPTVMRPPIASHPIGVPGTDRLGPARPGANSPMIVLDCCRPGRLTCCFDIRQ